MIALNVALILAALSGLFSLGEMAPRPVVAPSHPAPRPLVLVLHGRGHRAQDSSIFRRDVLTWMQDGARQVAGAPLFEPDDVRLVWYADLFDGRRALAACEPSRPGGSDSNGMGVLALLAGTFLELVTGDSLVAAPELRSLVGEARVISDPYVRCAADSRVQQALHHAHAEGRPVILVAYSMGGLVAWDHLQRRSASGKAAPIHRLITIGSPLASPVVRQLVYNDSRTTLDLPAGVRDWVNVFHEYDPFAAPLFPDTGSAGRGAVRDAVIRAESRNPHDLRQYLRNPVTARTIVDAWCDVAGNMVSDCNRVKL